MITLRALTLVALCTWCSGCFDFLEPDFPEAGAPAVLQAAAYVEESGRVIISGLLVPGLAIGGVQRRVLNDTLDIYGLGLAPSAIRRNGSREYAFTGVLPFTDPLNRPFELEAPVVEDVTGSPPRVRWFGIRKADPDTITWLRGTDLVLHIDTAIGVSQPRPSVRQWFLELRGSDRNFRLSSDGAPPTVLRIPPDFVPAATSGFMTVALSFFQSAQLFSPATDYIANITFSVQLFWVVRVDSP